MLDTVRRMIRQRLQVRVARRHVEHELIALHGAVAHALRARDPRLLATLPETPQWDYYQGILASGAGARSLNLAPVYDSYAALRDAALEAETASGAPGLKGPAGEPQRLWSFAEHTRRGLQDAIARVAPLAAQQGVRQAG